MNAHIDFAARVGVLLYDTNTEIDDILHTSVQQLNQQGLSIGGLLQRFGERLANGKRSMWVDDIATGESVRLDTPRGPGAISCILNPDALAHAACLLRRAAEKDHDAVVVSRFGEAEAGGRGMRAEIADAICSGAVVLIPVRFSLLRSLEDFLDGPATVLLPDAVAIATWVAEAAAHLRVAAG